MSGTPWAPAAEGLGPTCTVCSTLQRPRVAATKGLVCPAVCCVGIERALPWAGPEHPDPTDNSCSSGLVLMQFLCLIKIPTNSPFTSRHVGREVETVGKKGLCKWHSFRQLQNPFSAVLLAQFSLKVVILYKLACYLILLLWKAHWEDFPTTLERGGTEWADCWHWNISCHPARLNSNKVWGCKVVLDSIHFLNSWAGPSLFLSHVWKSSFFPSSFFCWL